MISHYRANSDTPVEIYDRGNTEGDVKVRTFATGFGTWHAHVTGDAGLLDPKRARQIAARCIRVEIAERETVAPAYRVKTVLRRTAGNPDAGQITYKISEV